MGIYRIQVRICADDPRQAEIIKKIHDRNTVIHRTISDYILHALYEFEDQNKKEETLRRILREELQNSRSAVLTKEAMHDKDDEKEENNLCPELPTDILELWRKG